MPDLTAPLPDLLAWSPDRPYTSRSTDWNKGCPNGYFAQFTPAGATLATPLPNGVEGVRCRLLTGDVPALAAESVSWEDTLLNVNAAILEGQGPTVNPVWWIVLGVIGLGIWERMQQKGID